MQLIMGGANTLPAVVQRVAIQTRMGFHPLALALKARATPPDAKFRSRSLYGMS